MAFLDSGEMNGHVIPGWILQLSDGWERHFCQLLSKILQGILSLTQQMHQERNDSALSCAPPLQKAVVFCPLPGYARHVKWWLTQYCVDLPDICHLYAEMGNDQRTEMQLIYWDSRNPSVFVTTPKVPGIGLNLTAANHAVITQTIWVLNEQRQAFAWVVQLGRNRVPHTSFLNMGPGGYGHCVSDLHQHTGLAQMWVQHGLRSCPNIMTLINDHILVSRPDHTERLTENGHTSQSDELSSEIVKTLHQGSPL